MFLLLQGTCYYKLLYSVKPYQLPTSFPTFQGRSITLPYHQPLPPNPPSIYILFISGVPHSTIPASSLTRWSGHISQEKTQSLSKNKNIYKEDILSMRTANNQDKANTGRGEGILQEVCCKQEKAYSWPWQYVNLSAPGLTALYGLWFGLSWGLSRGRLLGGG